MKHPRLLIGAGLVGAVLASAVIAQVTLPPVVNVGTADKIAVIPGGQPGPGNKYATAAQINGVPGYVNGGITTTGWLHTFGNAETNFFMQPAGTLALGGITAAAHPGDGQRECFLSTQTQTGITWTANTGQSITNAPTAGVAMVPVCMTWNAATSTWLRSP